MRKRRLLLSLLGFAMLFSSSVIKADEGMWLPSQIRERIADMQSKGFRLTAEDLYSINSSSLKDAVVHFNGGCTGELISADGLLITNHHCGFGQIQSHSSVEHDYLRDGFWAMSRDKELMNKNLSVSFLEYMEDVTAKVLAGVKDKMDDAAKNKIIANNTKRITDEAVKKGKGLRASVKPLFYGNQYFLYVYKVYTDVRLVGAPPASIGKFGGDTDNWMWPRHTGDFSLFRIYADKDNEPAAPSADNVPYKPKRHFKINASGLKEGDFTLVYGYPGRTNEYLMSEAVKITSDISNPHKIKLRTLRLDIQRKEMNKDQKVRIQYASKNASVANSWKKWQGEMKGIKKMNTYENKRKYEAEFDKWANENNKSEYIGLIEGFRTLYGELEKLQLISDYQREAINSIEFVSYAANRARRDSASFYKDYYKPIDKASFIALLTEYANVFADNRELASDYFFATLDRMGSVEKWADAIYDNEDIELAAELYNKTNEEFNAKVQGRLRDCNAAIEKLYKKYMRGQMEFNKETNGNRVFYPDANSTLRIAYGHIKGYSPADAVYYVPFSTLDGIIEKDNPAIYDYNIPQKLRDIYKAKDFGRWSVDGKVPVAFIATNHTSGGNSGSPVIDADGNLIGVNFDRVWEGTMSDVVFDPEVCRNIALDIRFALFVIDKLGAKYLLDEMDIIQ